MPSALFGYTATLLQDGTVLIAGGTGASGATASAAIYNPTTKTFTATGNMTTARVFHTATLLGNGMVLIAGGGIDQFYALSSAELYDPATKTFSPTKGPMVNSHYEATATMLNNGTVLICGGSAAYNGNYTPLSAYAEIYNPTTETFTATGNMIQARYEHTATLLFDGSVLIAGGFTQNNYSSNSAEIYVPSYGAFTPAGSLVVGRNQHSATLLLDGTVLLAGGVGYSNSTALSSAEIYNPSTLSSSATGSLNTARFQHTATPLYDGTVLIAGGLLQNLVSSTSSAEVYSPPPPAGTGPFTTTGNMTTPRAGQTANLLNDGTVLVAGGYNGSTNFATAELYSYPFSAGALNLKYIVLGVMYSPPGAKSTVSYGQSTTLGTSSTLTNTVNSNVGISASLGYSTSGKAGKTPISGSGTGNLSTNWTQQVDSSSTYTLNQTTTAGNGTNGPLSSAIGVDHDYDTVLVWLNPKVNLSAGALTGELLWNGYAFDSNDPYFTYDPDIVQLSIFCLKNPYFAPDCTVNNYRTSRSWDTSGVGGLTLADYAQIAAADPFYVNPLYDPNSDPNQRFTSTGNIVLFEPAPPGDGPKNWNGGWNFVAAAQDGESATNSYSEGFSIDVGIKFILSADLKYSNTATWTNKWSATQTTTVGQSAQYNIYGPVATDNYTGPTSFEVWQDNVYGTFMFVAPGTAPTTSGSIGVSPATLDFGSVTVGSISSPVQVVLTNNSVLPIFMGNPNQFPFTGTSMALSPVWAFSDPSLSVVTGSDACTGKIISPNATCTISVQWTPAASGTFSASMYLTGVTDAVVLATVPVNEVASKGTTTTALASSLNPSSSGQAVTFTATVTFSLGEMPAGESVTFMNGATQLGTGALSGGSASLTASTLPPGSNSITAVYAGDSNFNGSTSNVVSQVVSQATTTTALVSSLNPSNSGQAVTFTATVTSGFGTPPNGETVTFMNGTTSLGTGALSAGSASLTTSTLPLGTNPITAVYAGDSNFTGSTSNVVSQAVNAATTTTALVSSLNPSGSGKSVKFTATVTPSAATGTVKFYNGTALLATKTLSSGVVSYSTAKLPLGSNSITAVYGGDSNYSGSTSAPLIQVVLTATTTTLSSSLNPSAYGQAVTLTAVVTPAPPDGETVSFMKGATVLGTGTLSGGSASFTDTTLPVDTNTIKAEYGGDSNFSGSTSTAVSQVVSPATTTVVLVSSLNPSNSGQSVTFTATLEPQFSGTPTGTVTFYDGTMALKTVTLSGGAASYKTSTLAAGTHSITATYNGSTDFTGSSGSLTQTVN